MPNQPLPVALALRGAPVAFFSAGIARAELTESAAVKALFARSPCQDSSGPPRVRNHLLADVQIVETRRDPADGHIKQVHDHPHPGLMTPDLTDDWFGLSEDFLRDVNPRTTSSDVLGSRRVIRCGNGSLLERVPQQTMRDMLKEIVSCRAEFSRQPGSERRDGDS